MFCNSCGHKNIDEARFCEKCGTKQAVMTSPSVKPSRADALKLAKALKEFVWEVEDFLQEAVDEATEIGETSEPASSYLVSDFSRYAVLVAMADSRASYEEAALYKEVFDYLESGDNLDFSATDYESLLPKYEEGAIDLFDNYPKSWMFGIIERHDESQHTDFARKYRELTSRLVKLFVSAEGRENQLKALFAARIEKALEPVMPELLSAGENKTAAEQIIADARNLLETVRQPLSAVLEELDDGGEGAMTAEQYIFFEIQDTLFRFAESDGAIADQEAELCLDVLRGLQPAHFSRWDLKSLRNHALGTERSPEPHLFVLRGLSAYDQANGTSYAPKTHSALWRIANLMVKADGTVSDTEIAQLKTFESQLKAVSASEPVMERVSASSVGSDQRSLDDLLSELNSLIGLDSPKKTVAQLVNYLKVEQLRKAKGLKGSDISLHMVFYGNPGTGKTTVARLLAQIYRQMGLVSKGHLVETDRSGLVAGYVGQTALKVKDVALSAIGGILFIDEAYALKRDISGNNYGDEAIETLLKIMEDHRDDLVVIVAGYPKEMQRFIEANPGLQSRFNRYLTFEDYSPSELAEIFQRFCKGADYVLDPIAEDRLSDLCKGAYSARDSRFGNGRWVRNVFEASINNLASRVVLLPHVDEKTLMTVCAEDVNDPIQTAKGVGA